MANGAVGEIPTTTHSINLREVIRQKNPSLAAKIPKPLYRFLHGLLHIDDLNEGISRYGSLHGLDFVRGLREYLDLRVETTGDERLSAIRRPIVASNHPLGGLDGIALLSVVGKYHPDLVLPVNDFLMNIPNLRSLFVPVNKYGGNRDNYSRLMDIFRSDLAIIHFPAGLCSRKKGHLIHDLDWQKSVIAKARVTQRPIIPTYVDGRNSERFYRIAQLRKRTGWKLNVEMILLVDEMFRQRGKTLRIHFGRPISPNVFSKDRLDRDWARHLRRYVYVMGSGLTATFEEYVAGAN